MLARILVIDDSPDIHDLVAARLRNEDVQVEHADGGEQGLRHAQERRPDLILLDVDMPGMTGFEVCQKLQSEPSTADIPIIFLTAADQPHAKVQGFDLGAVDYVTKPFDASELRARVRAALRTKRYQDMLAVRAQVDAVTGLWNRAYFDRRLQDEIAAAQRYGRDVALVLIDLDHFKAINDSFGHPVGDSVLQRVGEALMSGVRQVDAACRYGGEEFACILTEASIDDAMALAQRIQVVLRAASVVRNGATVKVTASFGVASVGALGAHGESVRADTLVRAADEALYRAKRGGRDCIMRADTA